MDRSPCGTGTCAVMAVLAAMGLLGAEQTFMHESIIGTRFRGRVVGETTVGEYRGDRARDRGRGLHHRRARFPHRRRDPLRYGFRL